MTTPLKDFSKKSTISSGGDSNSEIKYKMKSGKAKEWMIPSSPTIPPTKDESRSPSYSGQQEGSISPNTKEGKLSERLRPRSYFHPSSSEDQYKNMSVSTATATTIQSIDLFVRFYEDKKAIPAIQKELKIKRIWINDRMIRTWYNSPYPAEYVQSGNIMYICNQCLKYMDDPLTYARHQENCYLDHPPGWEIYRQDEISIFEVDGYKQKLYCQNLCLLAKLFLDHKILYYDVNAFLFYVLTEYHPETGYRFIGYFSKERSLDVNNNVSCIVILPGFQNKGYGHFLIDFSYLLTRREGKVGGPETPLSELGFLAYAKYWSEVIIHECQKLNPLRPISYDELSKKTGIYTNHIICTLEWMECLLKSRDGQILLNFEKILSLPDALQKRKRPREQALKWSPL